ncbi:MAG: DUF4276 family protein [Deltaproteobacteria bacterium]|nr:DUF4276 family protein [Deltaproteobacteria bacterium]
MSRIVFLVEERSIKVFLDGVLPRFFPGLSFLCVPHEGRQDLENSIPRKLRAWREPGVRFVVVRDNDNGDCRALKAKLVALCNEGRRGDAVVRLACQELEAWYLGDASALADAFGDGLLRDLAGKERFRDPDTVVRPARALQELVPEFQKVSGARRVAAVARRDQNRSGSFRAFMDAVEQLAVQFGQVAGGEGGN